MARHWSEDSNVLKDIVVKAHSRMMIDNIFLMAVLANTASIISHKWKLKPRNAGSSVTPIAFWGCAVGGSGSGKTEVLTTVAEMYKDIEGPLRYSSPQTGVAALDAFFGPMKDLYEGVEDIPLSVLKEAARNKGMVRNEYTEHLVTVPELRQLMRLAGTDYSPWPIIRELFSGGQPGALAATKYDRTLAAGSYAFNIAAAGQVGVVDELAVDADASEGDAERFIWFRAYDPNATIANIPETSDEIPWLNIPRVITPSEPEPIFIDDTANEFIERRKEAQNQAESIKDVKETPGFEGLSQVSHTLINQCRLTALISILRQGYLGATEAAPMIIAKSDGLGDIPDWELARRIMVGSRETLEWAKQEAAAIRDLADIEELGRSAENANFYNEQKFNRREERLVGYEAKVRAFDGFINKTELNKIMQSKTCENWAKRNKGENLQELVLARLNAARTEKGWEW